LAKSIIDRTIDFMGKVWSGADTSTLTTPPAKGTDRSIRHFVALIVITLSIMAAGLYVALTDDGSAPPGVVIFTPTPTETTAASSD
jgi:hypothetical protein